MTALYQARQKAIDPEGWRAKRRDHNARFRRENPEKKAAWNAVYKALRNGTLTRPDRCEHCATECAPQASHTDYSRRLDVEWLCPSCHAIKDKKRGA